MIIATIFSICSLIFVQLNGESSIIISRWINYVNLSLDWSLQLNLLTASMVLMVNLVLMSEFSSSADINVDEEVNILDVLLVVSIILND